MAQKQTEEVAVAPTLASLVPAAPSFIPDGSNGLEQVGMKDMVLPRLTLCQNNSHARTKGDPKYIKGLEEGQFFNSLTGEIYGETIQIIPLFFYHSRIMFKDMKEGGGIICQAPDGKSCQLNAGGPCLHMEWGAKGEPPECNEFFNYPSLIYRGQDPSQTNEWIVVSLKTTGLNAGRSLNSLMRLRKKASYAGIYTLTSKPDKNKAGISYFTWDAKNGTPPWVENQALYAEAEKAYQLVRDGLLSGKIAVDNDSDDAFADRDTEV